MPAHNSEISRIFQNMADLLEIKGDNPFRIRAYRRASESIANFSVSVEDMVNDDRELTDIDGIGDDLAAKIQEFIDNGEVQAYEELKEEIPIQLLDMLRLPGIGPKKIQKIYEELGIDNLDDLKTAAENKEIQKLDGFGNKTVEKILEGIAEIKDNPAYSRYLYSVVGEYVQPLQKYIEDIEEVDKTAVAGSYRRCRETIGDLDILIICDDNEKVMDEFVKYREIEEVVAKGETKAAVILNSGLQVDLRAVAAESFGAALQYFTGSRDHNIELRTIARKKNLKINEYGVYRGDKKVAGNTEEEIYNKMDLPYIIPELRENRGEIEAGRNNELPRVVELEDIKGDLQMHTDNTDGNNTLEEMVNAARAKNYSYIGITDHSKRVSMAGGLDEERLLQQISAIEEMNNKYDDITILKSIEVDILKDGTLDLSDSVLEKLDYRVCSIHYNRNLSRKHQTKRILDAMDNPYFNIFAHPTGRIIGERKEIDFDMEKVMGKALAEGCILELNAYPQRLDLSDIYCKQAKELGLKISIATDAHSGHELDHMIYGINQARRGWLEAEDVINTGDLQQLKTYFKRE